MTAAITADAAGFYRCSVHLPATFNGTYTHRVYLCSADGVTSFTGDDTSGIYLWGAQLSDSASLDAYVPNNGAAPTAAAYYGPRLDYDPVTLQPKGFLVEEARTNLLLRSEEFDNANWTKSRATVTANAATAPDGTSNADKLVEDSTASATD